MRTGASTQQTIAGQWEGVGTKSWLYRHYRDTGYWNCYVSPDGSDNYTYKNPVSNSGGPGWHFMAVSVHYSVATPANGWIKSWLSDDGGDWYEVSGQQQVAWPVPLDASTVMRIGAQQGGNTAGVWDGDIAWVEMRSGLAPTGGTVLWRFDANDYPGSGTTWTDPRGRQWSVANATAIVKATSAPTLRVQTGGGPTVFSGPVTLSRQPQAPLEAATKTYVDDAMSSVIAGGIPPGHVSAYAGDSAPPGYLMCDGTLYLIEDYPQLAAVVGVKYGGDGTTTFAVPNLKGRAIFMLDPTVGVFNALGKTGGSRNTVLPLHTHTLASHTHTQPTHTHGMSSHTHNAANLVTANEGSHTHNVARARNAQGSGANEDIVAAGAGGTVANTSTAAGSAHSHNVTGNTGGPSTNVTAADGNDVTGGPSTNTSGSAGSDATDDNVPPFLVLNCVIKT